MFKKSSPRRVKIEDEIATFVIQSSLFFLSRGKNVFSVYSKSHMQKIHADIDTVYFIRSAL